MSKLYRFRYLALGLLLASTASFACDGDTSSKCRDAYFSCIAKSGGTPAGYQQCQDRYYACLRAGGCSGF